MDNKELIAKKQEQIRSLQEEIKSLRGPRGIASVMKNNFAFAEKLGRPIIFYGAEWTNLRKLVLMAFDVSYVKDLSEDQIFLAAEMADEILEVWNKYYKTIREMK